MKNHRKTTVLIAILAAAQLPIQAKAEEDAAFRKIVENAGGKVEFDKDGNPVLLDLYNGNNPLKGRGGKNEQVNDSWLKHLEGRTTIKDLNLANCAVTDAGMKSVGTLTGLENLNLTLTPVTDAGFVHFEKLTKLRTLGLASSQCSGTGFKHLPVKELENVNFHYTPLDDKGLEAICNVGVTGRFWFAHTHFTDVGTTQLSKLTKLKVLGIGSSEKGSTGQALAPMVKLPLEDLSILDKQADPIGITYAAQIKSLKKLDISYAPLLTDNEIALLAAMPNLETLSIGGSNKITDQGIAKLAGSKSLKHLTLQRLKLVTKDAAANLEKSNPGLLVTLK